MDTSRLIKSFWINTRNCMTNVSYLLPSVFIKATFVSLRLELVHEQVHVIIALVLSRRRRHFSTLYFVFLFQQMCERTRNKCLSQAPRKAGEPFPRLGTAEPDVYACTIAVRRGERSVWKHEHMHIGSARKYSVYAVFYHNNKYNLITKSKWVIVLTQSEDC